MAQAIVPTPQTCRVTGRKDPSCTDQVACGLQNIDLLLGHPGGFITRALGREVDKTLMGVLSNDQEANTWELSSR